MEIKVLDKGFVRLVDSMGSDSAIVQAARVSYGKGTKKVSEDEGLIRYLLRHKHTTPFEMVQFKFHIKAPIFVFRQWHRHRMWSYNEYSGRYSEMKDEFYVPDKDKITKQNPNNKQGGTDEQITEAKYTGYHSEYGADVQDYTIPFDSNHAQNIFINGQANSRKDYEMFISSGMRKELARINLPLAQYSEMYASVDLHNLFHFLKLRLDSHAQYEIRVFAEAISKLIQPIVPIAYKAFEDYHLKTWSISFGEQAALSEIVDILKSSEPMTGAGTDWEPHLPKMIQEAASRHFSNKREREECIEKLNKLILYHGPDYTQD